MKERRNEGSEVESKPANARMVRRMLNANISVFKRSDLLTACLICGTFSYAASATAAAPQPAAKDSTAVTTKKSKPHPSRYHPDRFAGRAGKYYELFWGIDSIKVKLVESGELVRFSYRVLDPDKAKALNDKASAPALNDPQAHVSLVVPTMEKVGPLRQSTAPEAGRSYWMTFSNKGRPVARGHRVDVVIGPFKAENLVVD
jgi:hypothetical protein